jgi:hypothetical protein
MNLERHDSHVSQAACIDNQPPQCVLPAIRHYVSAMKHTSLSHKERDKSLLLVGHFVADIHQPLHVSYKVDRGGTRQKVVFQGKPTNLHRLWDSQLLYCQSINGKRPTWRRLGVELFHRPTPALAKIASSTITWAQESFEITQHIYHEIKSTKGSRSLTGDYCERHYPTVLSRLQLAGSRLAFLLAK